MGHFSDLDIDRRDRAPGRLFGFDVPGPEICLMYDHKVYGPTVIMQGDGPGHLMFGAAVLRAYGIDFPDDPIGHAVAHFGRALARDLRSGAIQPEADA